MIRALSLVLISAFLLSSCAQPHRFAGFPYDPVLDAPAVTGIAGDDTPFNLLDLPEKIKLVFFGYTSCPDICPLTLSSMNSAYSQLSETQRREVAVVLISLDPERDTPERLGTYLRAFNPAFYGVHVPLEQLEQLKQDFKLFADKRSLDTGLATKDYLIDHTAAIFVIDGQDKLRVLFSTDASPDNITDDVRYLLTGESHPIRSEEGDIK